MNGFIPLTMSPSDSATAKLSGTCGCTAASDIRSNSDNGSSVENSHRATQTISNGTSNHSATQTNGHISDMVSRFHSSALAATEPIADNSHVSSGGMRGLWTKPITVESLTAELEEEKRKRREAEQTVRGLWEELIESKVEASQAKKELFKAQMALPDYDKKDSATLEDA